MSRFRIPGITPWRNVSLRIPTTVPNQLASCLRFSADRICRNHLNQSPFHINRCLSRSGEKRAIAGQKRESHGVAGSSSSFSPQRSVSFVEFSGALSSFFRTERLRRAFNCLFQRGETRYFGATKARHNPGTFLENRGGWPRRF